MATNHVIEVRLVAKGAKEVQNQLEGIKKSTTATAKALALFRNYLVLSAIGNHARDVITMADSFTVLNNKLRATVSDGASIVELRKSIVEMAYESRVSIDTVATAFSRFSLGARDAGVSSERLIGVVDTLTKLTVLSGATSTEASNALIQLSQGFASGTLRGDELRSVMEQLPTVARSIADSLGITIGELRKFGREGKLTPDVIVKAMEDAAERTKKAFENMTPTVEQSLQQLNTALNEFIGNLLNGGGPIASFFGAIARGIKEVNDLIYPSAKQRLDDLQGDLAKLKVIEDQSLLERLNNPNALIASNGRSQVYTDAGVKKAIAETEALIQAQKDYVEQLDFAAKKRDEFARSGAKGTNQKAEDILDDLSEENKLLKVQGVDRAILKAQLKAGVDAQSEYGKEIAKVAAENYNLEQSEKAVKKAQTADPRSFNKLRNLEAQVSPLVDAYDKLLDAQEAVNAAQEYGHESMIGLAEVQKRYTREVIGAGNAATDYEEIMQLLKKTLDETSISQEEYNLLSKKAADTYLGAAKNLMESVNPLKAANDALTNATLELDVARSRGQITATEEADTLAKLLRETVGVGNASSDYKQRVELLGKALDDQKITLAEYNLQLLTLKEGFDSAAKSIVTAADPIKAFNEEITKAQSQLAVGVQNKSISSSDAQDALTHLKREQLGVGNVVSDNQKKIELLNKAFKEGVISAREYQQMLIDSQLAIAEQGTDFASGFERFSLKMRKDAMTDADLIEQSFTNAFSTMTDALTDFVATGKLDFKGLVDAIIQDFARLAANKYMQDLFGGNNGTGGGLIDQLLGGLLGGGNTIVGGSISPGASGGTMGGYELSSSGSSGLMGFASGGSFMVGEDTSLGDANGIDNRLIAFRARDGEKVTVTPPGQSASSGGNITFVLNGVTDADSFRRSEGQISTRMQTLLSRAEQRNR